MNHQVYDLVDLCGKYSKDIASKVIAHVELKVDVQTNLKSGKVKPLNSVFIK